MNKKFSRRDFIKITAISAGGIAAAGGLMSSLSSESLPEEKPGIITRTPTYCEMCTFKCAGWVYKKNGRLWKITGNESDNHCYGRLCTKGSAGIGSYNDPDRLKKPLIRTSERGKQVFREASWDEALDTIADKMLKLKEKHGPESMALFTHGAGGSFFKTLLKGYGSKNIAAPSYANCRGPREEGYLFTYGAAINSPECTDMKNSRCIVLIGSHIGENTHSAQVNEFARALSRGASLIVVDPRFSTAASKARYWLPIKPATDIALLLAWINVIIREELYDREYVENYTRGFDQLKKAVRRNTPEWAYPITSIKPELIRETAREMAKHSPATLVHPGRHNVWYGDDTQRVRANAILNALLGSWGRKGGFYLPRKAHVPAYPHPKFPKPGRSWKEEFPGKWELANLAIASGICDATIPSARRDNLFKGWLVYGSNLMKALPNRKRTIEAINNLELLVVIDTMPSEITGWADVVLPECTYLERYDDIRVSPGRTAQIAVRTPAAKPKFHTQPAWWMARELAGKIGCGKYFPWKTMEEYLDFRLKKAGSSLKEMKKIGVKTLESGDPLYMGKGEEFEFGTDSRKIELYSRVLEEYGFDPVPRYKKHREPDRDYYRLLYGRSPAHSFGRTSNNPLLVQIDPENEVWMHTSVAFDWGIKNGQYLRLENQDGIVSGRIRAKVTERIRPDCVYMVHGFGHTQKQMKKSYLKGAADSDLMTQINMDPVMGGNGIRVNFVTFKVEESV